MSDLDNKLDNLKNYFSVEEVKRLNKQIYDLNLGDEFLKGLSQDKILYIHVKLHNSLSFRKPFADIKKIKKAHNGLIKFLKTHIKTDKLDE